MKKLALLLLAFPLAACTTPASVPHQSAQPSYTPINSLISRAGTQREHPYIPTVQFGTTPQL